MLTRIRVSIGDRLRRFAAWRRACPFWGGLTLTFGGLVIGAVPFDAARRFALVPGHFAFVGIIFAVLVILCGLFTLARPEFASFFGATGILMSIVSIFGALGGLFVGTLLSILGGSMCIAWVPPEQHEEPIETGKSAWRGALGGLWGRTVGRAVRRLR